MDLKKKLLLSAASLLILALGAASAWNGALSEKALQEKALDALALTARTKAELIDQWAENGKNVIDALAVTTEFEALLINDTPDARRAANRKLQEQSRTLPDFTHIIIADTHGEIKASSPPEPDWKAQTTDQGAFYQAMKGSSRTSGVFLSRTTGRPVWVIAAPIKANDRVIGIIYGIPDLNRFNEKFINTIAFGRSGYLSLYDASGVGFAHADKAQFIKRNMNDFAWSREMMKSKAGIVRYTDQDRKIAAAYSACRKTGWSAAVIVPEEEILTGTRRFSSGSVIIFMAGLAFILAILYFIIMAAVAPLRRISAVLDACADQVAAASTQLAVSSRSLAEEVMQKNRKIRQSGKSCSEADEVLRSTVAHAEESALTAQNIHIRAGQMKDYAKELTRIVSGKQYPSVSGPLSVS